MAYKDMDFDPTIDQHSTRLSQNNEAYPEEKKQET